MNYKKTFGDEGEARIEKYLVENKYIILAKQFSINKKIGEIDIVAKQDNFLVFVEVKRRKKNHLVSVEDMISKIKQKKIILMAKYFCQNNNFFLSDCIIRFDIAIIINDEIFYYENAFTDC